MTLALLMNLGFAASNAVALGVPTVDLTEARSLSPLRTVALLPTRRVLSSALERTVERVP